MTSGWWVVIPLKDIRKAKSRFASTPSMRRALVLAMAHDTLRAVTATDGVRGVVVVGECLRDLSSFVEHGVEVFECGGGLNESIQAGGSWVRSRWANAPIAVLPADLPYLAHTELEAALVRAGSYRLTVVADRVGRGSTLTTAAAGTDLNPQYGMDSLDRHQALGAECLNFPLWSGLRRDVDVVEDLSAAPALGAATAGLLQAASGQERKMGARCNE